MKGILVWLCIVPAAGILVGCGGGSGGTASNPTLVIADQHEAAPLGGTILGRVIDLQTGAGVSGAALQARLLPEQTGIVIAGKSDANGRFEFAGLSPGTWELRATKAHFGDGAANVQVLPVTISYMEVAVVNQGGVD